jgi:hypothetical protein
VSNSVDTALQLQEFFCWRVAQSALEDCRSVGDLDELFAHFCFGRLDRVHSAIEHEARSPVAQEGG